MNIESANEIVKSVALRSISIEGGVILYLLQEYFTIRIYRISNKFWRHFQIMYSEVQ